MEFGARTKIFILFLSAGIVLGCKSADLKRADPITVLNRSPNNEIADLKSQVALLQQKVALLEGQMNQQNQISQYMSFGQINNQPAVIFSGVNVAIQNGMGATESTNGVGNLILGYNEDRSVPADRSGSHNLVIGREHSYSSYAGIVSGFRNSLAGDYAAILGGSFNTVIDFYAAVVGGFNNQVLGEWGATVGGYENIVDARMATVLGGYRNVARGNESSVLGGFGNVTTGNRGVISGGYQNHVGGRESVISGGSNVSILNDRKWAAGVLVQ